MTNIDEVLGDPKVRDGLRTSLGELPELLKDTRSAVNTIQTSVESVDRNLTNLEGLTGPLGERGEAIVLNMDRSLAKFDELLTEMSDFGRKLNRGGGTFGKLMSDDQLYNHLNSAAANIDKLTAICNRFSATCASSPTKSRNIPNRSASAARCKRAPAPSEPPRVELDGGSSSSRHRGSAISMPEPAIGAWRRRW